MGSKDFLHPFNIAVRWDDGLACVGARATYAPVPPLKYEDKPVFVGEDGLWGYREPSREPQLLDARSPFLAALAVPKAEHLEKLYARAPYRDELDPLPGQQDRFWLLRFPAEQFLAMLRAMKKEFALTRAEFDLARPNDKHLKLVEAPIVAQKRAVDSLAFMARGGLRSYAELVAMWRAHQRAFLEMEVFVHWWDLYAGRLPREWGMGDWSRRGSVVSASEMDEYWSLFSDRLRLPIYAAIDTVEWKVAADARRVSMGSGRYSVTPSAELGKASVNIIYYLY